MIPVVAHTVAVFGERPIANAFGIALCITPTRGLGRSAWMQRRSIIACSSGASCGETSRTPIGAERDLVREEHLGGEQDRDEQHGDRRLGGDRDADQHHVDEAEQEEREQHPGLEPGVTAERRGTRHGTDLAKRRPVGR